jgi:hypothetical protein
MFGQLAVATEQEGEEPKQVKQESDHRAEIVAGSGPIDHSADAVLAMDTYHGEDAGRTVDWLLGGHIVGIEGAAKRVDVLATALHAGFTGQEVIHLDLGYVALLAGLVSRTHRRPEGRRLRLTRARPAIPRHLAFPEGAA